MKRLILLCAVLLSGCNSLNLEKTIAGGQVGSIDYCITVLGNNLFCVHAERVILDQDDEEE